MYKVTVETKSRSKHIFEINEEAKNSFEQTMSKLGFSNMTYLKVKDIYFNPENITSVKIEEVSSE